jgi:RNA polymerase sigma-70 factor (ECF subfamily)
VDEQQALAELFERERPRLNGAAYRMLGSATEAEDAVQETWLRLSRTDTASVNNLGGWLTTVVARVCLDMLRARTNHREQPLDDLSDLAGPVPDPEQEALLADSLGAALLVVLETLPPPARVAFVLHDLFGVPFETIAPILDRSTDATKQLASRARRRVQGAPVPEARKQRQRAIVEAFLAASRDGDFAALLSLLDPEVVLRADQDAVESAAANRAAGAPPLAREVRGARAVADAFAGRARAARLASIDGWPGAAFAPGGTPRAAFTFTVEHGRIRAIEVVSNPASLEALAISFDR